MEEIFRYHVKPDLKCVLENVGGDGTPRLYYTVPPTFLWHTFEDQIVPVENSLLFAVALRKKRGPFELHVYSEGVHGLALANDLTMDAGGGGVCKSCEGWLALACDWLRRPVKAYVKRDDFP